MAQTFSEGRRVRVTNQSCTFYGRAGTVTGQFGEAHDVEIDDDTRQGARTFNGSELADANNWSRPSSE